MSETETRTERSSRMWDDEDGGLYMLGHCSDEEFIGAAREFWESATGDDDDWWDEHYGNLVPAYIERVWWRPLDPSLTWETAEEAPGEWLDHDADRATPVTRYLP